MCLAFVINILPILIHVFLEYFNTNLDIHPVFFNSYLEFLIYKINN